MNCESLGAFVKSVFANSEVLKNSGRRIGFGTPAFNDQVANVNAITRVVLALPDMLALFFAFSMMYKALYALLPADEGTDPHAGDFWVLVKRREDALSIVRTDEHGIDDAQSKAAVQAQANRQAREEFGLT